MSDLFRTMRNSLNRFIHRVVRVICPCPPQRSEEEQRLIDQQTASLVLYEYSSCLACARTRRAMKRLGLNIKTRDVHNEPKWKQELAEQGGKDQVPCLRIADDDNKVSWLYESRDINKYLEQKFAADA